MQLLIAKIISVWQMQYLDLFWESDKKNSQVQKLAYISLVFGSIACLLFDLGQMFLGIFLSNFWWNFDPFLHTDLLQLSHRL